ncbi:MAG: hypothetical protein IT445_11450 [Phycisphaeraceae bacterium]|nr:hypothetical protein [Phycisphaeraceae bacterium]
MNDTPTYVRPTRTEFEALDSVASKVHLAAVAPTVDDDETAGFAAGRSVWIDRVGGEIYDCYDATAGEAVWRRRVTLDEDGGLSASVNLLTMTTAQREAITPDEGVPVWDSDLAQLFVGDGETVGGVAVGGGTSEPPYHLVLADDANSVFADYGGGGDGAIPAPFTITVKDENNDTVVGEFYLRVRISGDQGGYDMTAAVPNDESIEATAATNTTEVAELSTDVDKVFRTTDGVFSLTLSGTFAGNGGGGLFIGPSPLLPDHRIVYELIKGWSWTDA